MGLACPHCKADIPNALTQEQHVERLNVKEDANKTLREQLATAQAKVTELAPFQTKVATLEGELEKQRGLGAKIKAAAKVGLDPDKMRLAETAYDMAHEGIDAAKRPAFDAWLVDENGARKNDDIKHLFGQTAAPAAGATGTPPPPPAKKPPETPPTTPPGPGGKWSPAQVEAYFKSPEFKSMKREDQVKKVAELQSQVQQPPTQDGRA